MPTNATLFGLPMELVVLAAAALAVTGALLAAKCLRLDQRRVVHSRWFGPAMTALAGGLALAAILGAFGAHAFFNPFAAVGVCVLLLVSFVALGAITAPGARRASIGGAEGARDRAGDAGSARRAA